MFSQCVKNANRNVLCKGFVKLIDIMPKEVSIKAKYLGCDTAVFQDARNIEEIVEHYCSITITAYKNNKQVNLLVEQIKALKIENDKELTEKERRMS